MSYLLAYSWGGRVPSATPHFPLKYGVEASRRASVTDDAGRSMELLHPPRLLPSLWSPEISSSFAFISPIARLLYVLPINSRYFVQGDCYRVYQTSVAPFVNIASSCASPHVNILSSSSFDCILNFSAQRLIVNQSDFCYAYECFPFFLSPDQSSLHVHSSAAGRAQPVHTNEPPFTSPEVPPTALIFHLNLKPS